jgi:hypothetical protein
MRFFAFCKGTRRATAACLSMTALGIALAWMAVRWTQCGLGRLNHEIERLYIRGGAYTR